MHVGSGERAMIPVLPLDCIGDDGSWSRGLRIEVGGRAGLHHSEVKQEAYLPASHAHG